MYFCFSWFSNMVLFRYILVVLNFLRDIFSIKFYTISFLWDLFTLSFRIFLLIRDIMRWILDTEVKVFYESISYFMKWPWNCISWNALKEKFYSVSFPLDFLTIRWKFCRDGQLVCKKAQLKQIDNPVSFQELR